MTYPMRRGPIEWFMAVTVFPLMIYTCLINWQESWADYTVRATIPYEYTHRLVDQKCRAGIFGGKHICRFKFMVTAGDRRVFKVSYFAFSFYPDGIRMVRDADTGRITTNIGVAESFDRLVSAIIFYFIFFVFEAVLLVDLCRPFAKRAGLLRPPRKTREGLPKLQVPKKRKPMPPMEGGPQCSHVRTHIDSPVFDGLALNMLQSVHTKDAAAEGENRPISN